MIKNIFKDKPLAIIALLALVVSTVIRIIQIPNGLPHYSIDENDIVEFALGYYGGDLNPHWFKYGPLYSYFLAAIYWVISVVQGTNIHLFVENYFEDPTLFYVTSRAFNALIHTGLAFVAFQIGRSFFSLKVGLIAFILAIIPLADGLTNYTTRVDSLLALFMSLSLYFSLWMAKDVKNVKWYILAGAMLGFAIATKPLQAIVMMPSIYVAYIAGQYAQLRSESRKKKRSKQPNVFSIIVGSVVEKRLYILLGATLGALFIGHPYLFLDFESFWRDTFSAVTNDTQANWEKGYELGRFVGRFGWLFSLSMVSSVLYASYSLFKQGNSEVVVPLIYTLVYWLVFAFIPARSYFYIPILTTISILIARGVQDLNQIKNSKQIVVPFAVIVLIIVPIWNGVLKSAEKFTDGGEKKYHSLDISKKWLEDNVNQGDKILYYGYYVSLPKLIDSNLNEQAVYGDYFMYRRGENDYWIERFSQFMRSLSLREIRSYDIVYQIAFQVAEESKNYYTRYKMGDDEQYLYPYVLQSGIEYVVTNYDIQKYPEFQNSLAWTSRGQNMLGPNIDIYKVVD